MKVDLKWLVLGLTDDQVKGAIVVSWRAWLILLSLYVFWGWQVLGITRPVRADEVDQKIATAIAPVVQEQKEQRLVLETLSRQLNEQLANGVASEIRYLVGRKCGEQNSDERDRLQREIDRKQGEYVTLRKERYMFGCPDL